MNITTYSRKAKHSLFIDGEEYGPYATEIDMVRAAKKLGINFKELEGTPLLSLTTHTDWAFTNWA